MKKSMYIAGLLLVLNSPFIKAAPNENLKDNKTIIKKNINSAVKRVPIKPVTFNILPATGEARRWLTTLDKKEFGSAWEKSSILVRNTITKEEFIKQSTRSREPMGSFVKREIIMAQPKTELPGAPKGQYVLITFKSQFHHKDKVSETIMMQKDPDNSWRVAGYFAY